MTRLLLIFLLTVLPLQMSWAVAAVYCVHEDSVAVQHVGHHEHEHKETTKTKSLPTSLLAADADCGVCQLGHVGIAQALPEPMPLTVTAPAYSPGHTDLVSLVRPERPERPKWARAV
ncbi:MAG: cobalt-zinc-cadmium resistance protein [Oxalobacteraceae bacterium]|nr:cobalt-zinc-cadmium resistance protein [Oxalobacteraceae bacterium]